MNKIILVGTLLSLLSSVALATDSSSYARLYQDTIINDERVNGDLAKAQAFTDCHLTAIGVFPTAIQNALYQTATDTNDFAAARKALSEAMVLEMASSEEAKANIAAQIAQGEGMVEACIAGIDA